MFDSIPELSRLFRSDIFDIMSRGVVVQCLKVYQSAEECQIQIHLKM